MLGYGEDIGIGRRRANWVMWSINDKDDVMASMEFLNSLKEMRRVCWARFSKLM